MKKQFIIPVITMLASALTAAAAAPLTQDQFIEAAESTVNGVVSVKSFATVRQGYSGQDFFDDPFFQYFFGNPGGNMQPRRQEAPRQQQVGLGSGVIISSDGFIVTNNHVIDGAERLEVTLNDNRNFAATVVGNDPVTDLALIKIDDAENLHVIPMGDSDSLRVGQWVLAVGNPFGFTSSVTAGIVSAKARSISSSTQTPGGGGIEAYIQTDAAVNQGNSGGALVNLDGELVGINAAIYSRTGNYAGCSFAIPTSIVSKVVADLKEYGTVQRAFLGIAYRELTPELISEKGIKGVTRGIYVGEVTDRSAAREAGIREGDIIVSINNMLIAGTAELQEIMARLSPGDRVAIGLMRDGKPMQVTVTMRNRDGNYATTAPETPMGVLGATFEATPAEELQRLEIARGVTAKVTPGGRFANAGIKDGFIITAINGNRISSPEEIETIFKSIRQLGPGEDKVMFISGLYPTGKRGHYAVDLGD